MFLPKADVVRCELSAEQCFASAPCGDAGAGKLSVGGMVSAGVSRVASAVSYFSGQAGATVCRQPSSAEVEDFAASMRIDLTTPGDVVPDLTNLLILGSLEVASTEVKLWGSSGAGALALVRVADVATHAAHSARGAHLTTGVGDVHVYDVASYPWPIAECVFSRRTSRALMAPVAEEVVEATPQFDRSQSWLQSGSVDAPFGGLVGAASVLDTWAGGTLTWPPPLPRGVAGGPPLWHAEVAVTSLAEGGDHEACGKLQASPLLMDTSALAVRVTSALAPVQALLRPGFAVRVVGALQVTSRGAPGSSLSAAQATAALMQSPRARLDTLVHVGVSNPLPRVTVDLDVQDAVLLVPQLSS